VSTDVPKVIRAQPAGSDLLIIDERVPLAPLIKALSDGGFTTINNRSGKLVVTYWPEDYRAAAVESEITSIRATRAT
jgi:hypothetical protein